jgi:7-cyano-7-deazaguanine synthase
MSKDAAKALVLFSGGQDSTTCLAWALDRYSEVETVGFDYGQRHAVELACRVDILNSIAELSTTWQGRLGVDHELDLQVLGSISETALTRDRAIEFHGNGLPTTFVPGRNLAFLIFAAALAYRRGIQHIVLGVCQTDYSGYPDCRDDSIKAMQVALNLGMEGSFFLHTPLMLMKKSDTWFIAQELGGRDLIDLLIEKTHTCYLGSRDVHHVWGYGCGSCPACELRAAGYDEFIAAAK